MSCSPRLLVPVSTSIGATLPHISSMNSNSIAAFPHFAAGGPATLFPALAMSNNTGTAAATMATLATLTTVVNQQRSEQIKFAAAAASAQQQPLAINLEMQSAIAGTNNKVKAKKSKKPANHTSHHNCSCCSAADKPFLCDWADCGKRFRQKPHLEAHRNIHTGRRFVCEWPSCGKSFVRKYNLVEHSKMHTTHQNICTYPDCNKVFSSKYSLVRHQNAQHNITITS